MKKFLSSIFLCFTLALSCGLVACSPDDGGNEDLKGGGDGDDKRGQVEALKNEISTLAFNALAKIPDAFDADELSYDLETSGNYYRLEKNEDSFLAYNTNSTTPSYSSHFTYSLSSWSGKTFNESIAQLYEEYDPIHFFKQDDNYYFKANDWENDGSIGDIDESVYEEILDVYTCFGDDSFAPLFDANNYDSEITIYENRVTFNTYSVNHPIEVGNVTITSRDISLYFNKPVIEVSASIPENNSWFTLEINYTKGIQEFADFYTSTAFDSYNQLVFYPLVGTNTTDEFGYKDRFLAQYNDEVQDVKVTLPSRIPQFIEKIDGGNYRVKVTSTKRFDDSDTLSTKNYEYVAKDGTIKKTVDEQESYYELSTKTITEKWGDKFVEYCVGENNKEFELEAMFCDSDFVATLNRSVFEWSDEKNAFVANSWVFASGDGLFSDAPSYVDIALTYDYDSFEITVEYLCRFFTTNNEYCFKFEFDQIDSAEFTKPVVSEIDLHDILNRALTTKTYTLQRLDYDSLTSFANLINGEGLYAYQNYVITKDGKYLAIEKSDFGVDYVYEIDEDVYEQLLTHNGYFYEDLFDEDNYEKVANGYTFESDTYQGVAEIEDNKIKVTINSSTIDGPALPTIYYIGFMATEIELEEVEVNAEAFDVEKFENDTQNVGYKYEYDNYDWSIDGNVVKNNWYVDTYYYTENGVDYCVYKSSDVWVKCLNDETLPNNKEIIAKLVSDFDSKDVKYVTLNDAYYVDEDGKLCHLTIYHNGLICYRVDGKEYTFRFSNVDLTLPTPTLYAKTLDEIKADFANKNFVMDDGERKVAYDGDNFMFDNDMGDGYVYVIKNDNLNKMYSKRLNEYGVFAVSEEPFDDYDMGLDSFFALLDGLTSTNGRKAWNQWKNEQAGVTLSVNMDGSYVMTFTENGTTATFTKFNEVEVDVPNNNSLALFKESLEYHRDFTYTVQAHISTSYAGDPDMGEYAGELFTDVIVKSDANGTIYSYSSTIYDFMDGQMGGDETSNMFGKKDGSNSKLYVYDESSSSWISGTVSEDTIDEMVTGIRDQDLDVLFDYTNYDYDGSNYVLNGILMWNGVEVTNVVLSQSNDGVVLRGTCVIEGLCIDLSYTFSDLMSTEVTLPNV